MSEREILQERREGEFWDRIIAARKIIDTQPYAVMSNRTKPSYVSYGATVWGIVHWKTAESLAALFPATYRISRRGRHIRNIKLHPEENG
jgi:hypothetical protein